MKNKYDVASKSFSTTLGESHSGLTVLNNKNSTLDTSPFRHTDTRETPAEKVLSIEQRYEKDSYLNCSIHCSYCCDVGASTLRYRRGGRMLS